MVSTKAISSSLVVLFAIVILSGQAAATTKIGTATNNKISSGKLYIQVKQTAGSSPQLFQLSYDSNIKSELTLTQSSKIQIEAKMKFPTAFFDPELFSFRLIHPKFDKLTQPVKATYDSQSQSWKCIVDLGDPRIIQPFSDLYKLQLIIADERLSENVRNTIANVRINFRYSIPEDKIPDNNTPIKYKPESIIRTSPPEIRVDPPATFTIFLVVVMAVFTILFFYGLFGYLKVNVKLLPTDGMGLVLNLGLISLLAVNLVFLGKFWLQWNFITTVVNFFWLTIATALVANYALLYMKNRQ